MSEFSADQPESSPADRERLLVVLSTIGVNLVGVIGLSFVSWSDWRTGLGLNLIDNAILIGYAIFRRDRLMWHLILFGLLVGVAFLILPGVGPVVIAGPLAAAMLGGVEGALAGAAIGGIMGALVGLGVSKDKAIRYESQVKAGKFLVTLQGDGSQIEHAKSLFTAGKAETAEVFGPVTTAA